MIPYDTRHRGVGRRVGHSFEGSRRIMGYRDCSRLLEIVRDQVSLAGCVSLEFVEFRGCLVVCWWAEIYIS